MKTTQKMNDVDAAIQKFVKDIKNAKKNTKGAPPEPPVMTLAELDAAMRDIAYEMSLTTLVIREVAAETGINLKECVERAKQKLDAIAAAKQARETREEPKLAHPQGATIFGGDQ